MYLKLAPTKRVMRFRKMGKLNPRFIRPIKILDRIGTVGNRFVIPPQLSSVHNAFHVSMLHKYKPDPSHVISFEPIVVSDVLSYEEKPI